MARSGCIADAPGRRRRGSATMAHISFVVILSAIAWNGAAGFTMPASSAARSVEAWRVSRQRLPRWCRGFRSQRLGRDSLQPGRQSLSPRRHSLHTHTTKRNGAPSVSTPLPVEELLENDPSSLAQSQPPPKTVETRRDVGVNSEEEGVLNSMAAVVPERGGEVEEPSPGMGQGSRVVRQIDVDSGEERVINSTAAFAPEEGGDAKQSSPRTGQDSSVLRQMSVLVVVAG
ncbi:unnamed protein product, partial [Laminaria digitata]